MGPLPVIKLRTKADESTVASAALTPAAPVPVPGGSGNGGAAGGGAIMDSLRSFGQKMDVMEDEFDDDILRLTLKVHKSVVEELGGQTFKPDDREKLRPVVESVLRDVLASEKPLTPKRRQLLTEEVLNETLGFGPIQALLDDPKISEVMVNSAKDVFCECGGKIRRSKRHFVDDSHVMNIIDRIVRPLGRQASARTPMVDGRLPNGSRVNIVIPPVALKGPGMTIRKFSTKRLGPEDLIKYGSMTEEMALFLQACVVSRMNMIVSGGTGSGKTTLLNVLSNFIPHDERIVTAEDAAELQIYIENLVTLESRPRNIEGEGEITIRDLVRNALRMRPERIVVGECRGGECLDMLQAMNTGHDGSLSTIHANSPRDALSRMETLTLMAGLDLPLRVVSKQIASAVHVIVQQSRLSDGSRKVIAISELQGMEGDTILLQEIFTFEQQGIDANGKVIGRHKPTGFRPKCMSKLEVAGCKLPRNLFSATSAM